MAPDSHYVVYLPLDAETRRRLMLRAAQERRDALELGAELLAAKLAADDEQASRRARAN